MPYSSSSQRGDAQREDLMEATTAQGERKSREWRTPTRNKRRRKMRSRLSWRKKVIICGGSWAPGTSLRRPINKKPAEETSAASFAVLQPSPEISGAKAGNFGVATGCRFIPPESKPYELVLSARWVDFLDMSSAAIKRKSGRLRVLPSAPRRWLSGIWSCKKIRFTDKQPFGKPIKIFFENSMCKKNTPVGQANHHHFFHSAETSSNRIRYGVPNLGARSLLTGQRCFYIVEIFDKPADPRRPDRVEKKQCAFNSPPL